MENASSMVFAAIAPHPPIMVPEVGHESIVEVRNSIDAMAVLTRRLIASGAETVVLISPHAPLDPNAFVAYEGPMLYGDFANFSAPETTVAAPLDEELLDAIVTEARQHNYDLFHIRGQRLDHGTTVPLYFLQRNGWQGRIVALGYSFLSNDDHLSFGACIKRATDKVGRPVAFVASGDLSHRLKPEAPAGYNPKAHLFDEEIIAALRGNCPLKIITVDQNLRKLAGECGYRSLLVALGALRDTSPSCEVLNYEAPFGVGYLVAQLLGDKQKRLPSEKITADEFALSGEIARSTDDLEDEREHEIYGADQLPALARAAVETFVLTGLQFPLPRPLEGTMAERVACFVSIKFLNGDLRGCIGTIEPTRETLAQELILNAIQAASRDPRFSPITASELPELRYSVDVLSAPEATTFAELDPKSYGVIVEDEEGSRRGLLLPDIEGVDTAARQVEIAARKAGIPQGAPVRLLRFRVQRFSEA